MKNKEKQMGVIPEVKIGELFQEIEKCPLPVETIICGVCGNVLSSKDKTTHACEHQKQMVEGLEKW